MTDGVNKQPLYWKTKHQKDFLEESSALNYIKHYKGLKMERSELITTISKFVSDHWDDTKSALLIADIPAKIKEKTGLDYKTILEDERLKAFATDTQGPETYKVVMHPTQIAKIGLVPDNEEFSFNLESDQSETLQKNKSSSNSRNVTLSFLEEIDKLPLKEKMSIDIPTYIIAKLISKK